MYVCMYVRMVVTQIKSGDFFGHVYGAHLDQLPRRIQLEVNNLSTRQRHSHLENPENDQYI